MSGRKPRPAPACQCPARPTHRPHGTVTTLLRTDTGTALGPVGPSPPRHGRMPSTPAASLWQTSPTTAFSNAECGRSSPVARSSTGTAQACRRASRASSHTPPAPPSSAPPHDEKPPHSRQAIFGPSPRATHRTTDTVFPGTTPPPARAPLAPDLPTTPRPGSSIRGMPTPPRPPSNPDKRIATPARARNLAAMIAAACGLPGLAADLSWQQFRLLRRGWPLNGRTAIAALQPLANLARPYGRARRPDRLHQVLSAIAHALDPAAASSLDDTNVTLANLTTAEDATPGPQLVPARPRPGRQPRAGCDRRLRQGRRARRLPRSCSTSAPRSPPDPYPRPRPGSTARRRAQSPRIHRPRRPERPRHPRLPRRPRRTHQPPPLHPAGIRSPHGNRRCSKAEPERHG